MAPRAAAHRAALAYELASRSYRSRGRDLIADTYLREARACYLRWGADGKVKQIDELHPPMMEDRPSAPTATLAVRSEQLDLLSVVKASQTISGEMEIRKLVGKTKEKGLTLVPLEMYFKNGRVKVLLALAKGKQAHDKRETLRKREVDRETRAAVKSRR